MVARLLFIFTLLLLPALTCAGVRQAGAETTGFSLEQQELRAQLSPRRFTTLASELGAKIEQITVLEGERFRRGQVLVKFDCALHAAQLAKAEAQLMGAENTLAGNRTLAQLNAIGQVELVNSEVELLKAKADLAYLQATIDKCTIRAPYAGRAGELKAREQQFVQAGQALLEILDDSALELEFFVPSRWLLWLKPQHPFRVFIDETGKTYPAKLLRTAARADPVSQSVKAIAVIDGEFPELLTGMSGRVLLAPAESL